MHRQDGRQEIDRRTLLAKGAAFCGAFVTGCARKESRGFPPRVLDSSSFRRVRPRFCALVRIGATGPVVAIVSSRWAG